MESYLLEMKEISKSFGAVKALKKASLNLKSGEVLALMGENGAGKSTLMNVLSGSLHPDEGEILLEGVQREIKNPIQARSLGNLDKLLLSDTQILKLCTGIYLPLKHL